MNKQEAVLCAKVALLAYGHDFKIADFQLTARFDNAGTNTQGIFGEAYGHSLVIAFRGSEETGPGDWITDLKIFKQVLPYGDTTNKNIKVHYGFIEAYKSVRQSVIDWVKKSPLKRILCTGHSLGAALATLAALDVQYNYPDKTVFNYNFGSPKVGNTHFVNSYNKRVPNTYRFVNGADIVPNIPPGDYAHVGKVQPIGKPGGDWKDVVSKVEAHLPMNYLKVLEA